MFLVDGFRTIVTMSLLPGVFLREKEVTPYGLSGGGGIETTTMRNAAVAALGANPGQAVVTTRTFTPKSCVTIKEMSFVAQYDPVALTQILAVINVIQVFTIVFPDGAVAPVTAWLDDFQPQQVKEGDFPLADVKIIPTGTTTGQGGAVVPSAPVLTPGFSPGVLVR